MEHALVEPPEVIVAVSPQTPRSQLLDLRRLA